MPRFFTGDELGNIKSFNYASSSTPESKVTVTTLHDGSGKGKERAVQNLAIHASGDGPIVRVPGALPLTHPYSLGLGAKLAVARADGSASVSKVHAQGLDTIREWTEPRLKPGQRYVGLAASSAYVTFFAFTTRPTGANSRTNLQGEYTRALRTAPFASRRWRAATWTQSPRERQSCPCACAHGASRQMERRSLTEATRSSSQSGTLRPPFRRNCNHRLRPPPQNRPNNPKLPGSANAAPSRSFPENCGEPKMYVL